MRHLIRRQAFREELTARPDQFRPLFFVLHISEQCKYGLMVQGSHFHQDLLLGQGTAAEFVSPSERRFSLTGCVIEQSGAGILLKNLLRISLSATCTNPVPFPSKHRL